MGYSHLYIGCVFVEYDPFNTANLIQHLKYIRFGIILTQFYINFSRQEDQIDVLYVSFNARDSQVSSYTPFHFSFTVPLSTNICVCKLIETRLCSAANSGARCVQSELNTTRL